MSGRLPERRIIITGAGGFVGGFLIAELLSAGYSREELFGVSIEGTILDPSIGQTHVCDLRDREAIDALIRTIRPTGLVHLAAVALPARAKLDPAAAWSINFDSVREIGLSILRHAPEALMVFAGSSEIYGESFNRVPGAVDEAVALRPMTPYAATKAAADIVLGQMRHDGLNAVRFRAFNHSGPGQSPDYVIPSLAQQIVRIKSGHQPPVIRVGNLDAERDFLDVRDVVRAYRLALEAPIDPSGEALFNLASGHPRSIRSILDSLIEISGVKVAIEADVSKLRANDVPRTWGASTRAARDLGWSPRVAFEQTLADTLGAAKA